MFKNVRYSGAHSTFLNSRITNCWITVESDNKNKLDTGHYDFYKPSKSSSLISDTHMGKSPERVENENTDAVPQTIKSA